MSRRVVITGVGSINALGNNARESWAAMLEGRSGIDRISHFDAADFSCQIAAEVKGFDPLTVVSKPESRKMDPFTLFGLAAAQEALTDAGMLSGEDVSGYDPDRAGCIMGVGIGGLTDIEAQKELMMERGPRRISPHFIPKIMMNAVAGRISMRYGLRGPNFVTASACASANHAIGLAMRSIKMGDADVMLTGGAEATITPLGIAGFCSLRAMSTRNDDPQAASRPFDKGRDGFVMGEGAGALVFEEYEHARRRGAEIYAEVSGFGMTADAHHITAPAPEGRGAAAAMRMALEEAGVDPSEVDYINAHGTSTPINDPLETQAVKTVFGEHAQRVAISSTKSMTGHLLGAAGAVELVVTALSIKDGRIHPTANYEERDPECDLDYVPGSAREQYVRHALSNSLGFGGHNAVLILSHV
jgi:3-oxoacyl-[acyl-carrier-protein] synthase II